MADSEDLAGVQGLENALQVLQGQGANVIGNECHAVEVTKTAVLYGSQPASSLSSDVVSPAAGVRSDNLSAMVSGRRQQEEVLPQVFGGGDLLSVQAQNAGQFGNVAVSNSTDVRLGNVTYIMGNVYVTQDVKVVQQQTINQHVFLSAGHEDDQEIYEKDGLRILRRLDWRADTPAKPLSKLELPVSHVIISHTATGAPVSQEQVAFLVRTIQTYHVESRDCDDICYNFLVGLDGNVYEGRGWSYMGAHTRGFNAKSIGISFIGTFMKKLPNEAALAAFEKLIVHGIELGIISKDYKLCAHCQISHTESPGKMLYELIKTWQHWVPRP